MAIHPDFPSSPHAVLSPEVRWFPADEVLRESSYEKLLPPLVHTLRRKVMAWREAGYEGASDTSVALLNWWFTKEHLLPGADGNTRPFRYYFAQQEAVETVVYLYDAIRVRTSMTCCALIPRGRYQPGCLTRSGDGSSSRWPPEAARPRS